MRIHYKSHLRGRNTLSAISDGRPAGLLHTGKSDINLSQDVFHRLVKYRHEEAATIVWPCRANKRTFPH